MTIKKYRLAILNSHPVQYFAPLYRKMARESPIDVTVFYCSRQGVEPYYKDKGFGKEIVWDTPLLEGYTNKFLKNILGDRGVRGFFSLINFDIVKELKTGKFDALIIHNHNHFTDLLALLTAKWVGIPVFLRCETHLLLRRNFLKKLFRRPFLTMLFRLCDGFLYIGSRNREFYKYFGVNDKKLFFTPYSVDNDFFKAAVHRQQYNVESIKRRLGLAFDIPVILYVSKLIDRKRPVDLLTAYEKIRQRGIRAALVVVGDGPELPRLKARISNNRIPDVYLLGFRNQTELPTYYAIADVFVLPSQNEPWGLILNEVMCAGIPVITTWEVGAACDLVLDRESGLLYEAGDIDALANHIEKVLSDSNLQSQMRSKGLERINQWHYGWCIRGITDALEVQLREDELIKQKRVKEA